MLSDKEIRSMIWTEFDSGELNNEEGEEQMLDLSHQQLRRLREIELKELDVQRINASYNFFKEFQNLNFKEFKERTESTVKWIDLSFNYIRNIDQSAQASHVLKTLRYLNLTANQIESVDFTQLELPLLQTLNLNSNRLKFFLHCPETLKVLSINDNQLSSLAFTGGDSLTILTAKKNVIKNIGLVLPSLLVFDIESNKLEDITLVKQFLRGSPALISINLRENPVAKARQYKLSVLQNCPQIGQIDFILISPHIRQGFKAEQKLNDLLDEIGRKYQMKLAQKQKIKEDLIKKIRSQQKNIEDNFHKGISEQKEQFEILEKKAKGTLAKNKLAVVKENKDLSQSLAVYANESEEEVVNYEQKQKIQKEHLNEYLDYLNKKRPYSEPQEAPPPKRRRVNIKPPSQSNDQDLPNLTGIVLFDQRAVESLLANYKVSIVQF